MRALRHCQCEVVTSGASAPVVEIADLMDRHSVGCVVVVDDEQRPLGVVTDRDLLRRVVAADRDPEKMTAADVMSRDVCCAGADEPLSKVLEHMRERCVRRIPVVEGGRVVGIASLDDVLMALSADLWNVAEAVRIELRDAERSVRRRRWSEHRQASLHQVGAQARELGRSLRELAGGEVHNLSRGLRRSR